MPLPASVKGAITLPLAGQIQSTSSLSVPGEGFSGSAAGAGAGAATGGATAMAGGGTSSASGDGPDSAAFICASVRSLNGTFDARGSTFIAGVLARGRASIRGPAGTSGAATGPAATGRAPPGARGAAPAPGPGPSR